MLLDFYDVNTGICKETELSINDVFLYDNYFVVPKKEYRFETLAKDSIIDGYQFITGFGSDDEIDYNPDEVIEFFRFLNDFVFMTMIQNKYKNEKEIYNSIKNEKEKIFANNKWQYSLSDLEIYAEQD